MILYIIRFFQGMIKIKIVGSYIERFFNICAKNNIELWNITHICVDEVHCYILSKDYKKLQNFKNKIKCNIEILQKKGFLYLINRSKKRYILFLGIFLTFVFNYTISNYIWQINIEGTEKTALIFQAIAEENIKIGTKNSDINSKLAQSNIISKYEEFLWIALNVKGNALNISVKEREETPKVVDLNSPCDIIAEKSGQILSIDVLMGERVIEDGQTFTYGDILVSSEMVKNSLDENVKNRFVHAIANIKAKIWYNFESIMSRNINEKTYTGNETKRYSIVFLNNEINLYKNSSNIYLFYDKIVETEEIHLSKSVEIPIKLVTETYIEYELTPCLINEDFATQLLEKNLNGDILKNINGDILETKFINEINDDYIKMISEVTTLENIGIKKERINYES